MPFIQPSATNNTSVSKTIPIGNVTADQLIKPITNLESLVTIPDAASLEKMINPPKATSSGLASLGLTTAVTGIVSNSTLTKATQVANSAPIKALLKETGGDKLIAKVVSDIQSRLNVFDKKADTLASGISGGLSNIFGNTNSKSGSTVPTQISDPVSTNLLEAKKKPGATSFKVTSAQAGAQSVTSAQTIVGSGAPQMTSTSLATLLGRFSGDSSQIKNLSGTIAGDFSKQRTNGLFGGSITKALAGGITKALGVETNTLGGKLLKLGTDVAINVAVSKVMRTETTTGVVSALSNDLSDFNGATSALAKTIGVSDLSAFYVANTKNTLIDENRNIVQTNGSTVDSSTANAILKVLKGLGCNVRTTEYFSANQADSLFGLGLLLAALQGMTELVNDLLGCSRSSTSSGQKSLTSVFGQVAGSQPDIAKSILDKIDAPQNISSPTTELSILTNSKLTASSKTVVDSLFSTMGTTTKSAITLPGPSFGDYVVLNGGLIPKINSGFTNAVLQDSTVTDFFKSRPLGIGTSGKLAYA